MMASIRINRSKIVQATKKQTATLFFFHGSGSTGEDIKEWVDLLNREEFKFPHIKVFYPTAPIQPYTPSGKMPSSVWFDRKDVSIHVPEILHSVDAMCEKAIELIDSEVNNGIPYNRIIVGGFSMGGALSFHLAYRFRRSLAGCYAISSFLNDNSAVYESLRSSVGLNLPPLIQFHGSSDTLVPHQWGQTTNDNLKGLGVHATFITLQNIDHEIHEKELQTIKSWILKLLPDQ